MNAMLYAALLSALLVLISPLSHGIGEVKPQHDGTFDIVDVLQNGSVQVTGTYEAVDINKAAAQAMPDKEELQDLLHWAIKHSDPKVLKEAASGKVPQDAAERRKEVEEAIEYLRKEPGEAELMKEATSIINDAVSGEDARLQAFEALSYLLEPVDNANDLHKMGGIEMLQGALGEHNSRPLRSAAANALAMAASNNEEFQQQLWDMCGRDILDKLLQLIKLDARDDTASKGLYALSKLLGNENFRRAFLESGGMATLQRLLAGHNTPPNVRRKALAMIADLAHHQDTAQHLYALPEWGRTLLTEIEQQLSADDWDLTEKALLALKALMQMPGASQLFQGADPTNRLQALMKSAAGDSAKHAEYMEDVQKLIKEVQSMRQAMQSSSSSRNGHSQDSEAAGQKIEL